MFLSLFCFSPASRETALPSHFSVITQAHTHTGPRSKTERERERERDREAGQNGKAQLLLQHFGASTTATIATLLAARVCVNGCRQTTRAGKSRSDGESFTAAELGFAGGGGKGGGAKQHCGAQRREALAPPLLCTVVSCHHRHTHTFWGAHLFGVGLESKHTHAHTQLVARARLFSAETHFA